MRRDEAVNDGVGLDADAGLGIGPADVGVETPTNATTNATTNAITNATTDADELRRQSAVRALFDALEADPRRHDFLALLRRIDCLHPHWPRFGQALRPSQEALRLGQEPALDFAPAALDHFERDADGDAVPRLLVRFFGLLGPQGPMPLHLCELARERSRLRGDPTLARFLDVFHHRLLSLFYRAWAQCQPTVQHDRPRDDRFAAWLGAAIGFDGLDTSAGAVHPNARLHQAGLLASRSRHPEGLSKLLSHYFQVPVRIEQHVAQWLAIAPQDRSRLGQRDAQLGRSATAGSKVRDRQYKFRVALGPLTLAAYRDFLPGGDAWRALCDWVRRYAGLDLQWDVQLMLSRAEVPEPRLCLTVARAPSGQPEPVGCDLSRQAMSRCRSRLGPQLGITTWLGHDRRTADPADLRIRPDTSFLLRHGAPHA